MFDVTRAQQLARELQIAESEIAAVPPEEIFHALRETIPQEVWKIGLNPTGEDGSPVRFWRIRGHYYLDDPTFTAGLVDFLDMDYNSEIGLHVRPGKSPLTSAKLPPPGMEPPQPSSPPPPTTIVAKGPFSAVFLAINHYVSTGDHLGEGTALDLGGGQMGLAVPYAPSKPIDADDWRKLEARIKEIIAAKDLRLSLQNMGQNPPFVMMLVKVATVDIPRLAQLLRARPGPLGWGSSYPILQEHGLTDKGSEA